MQATSVLEQKPLIPARIASSASCRDVKTVTIRITAPALLVSIRRDAVNPSSTGMLKSMTVRCGLEVSCFSTPSPPSTASQQTCQSVRLSNSKRSCFRNAGWSSTIRIRAKAATPISGRMKLTLAIRRRHTSDCVGVWQAIARFGIRLVPGGRIGKSASPDAESKRLHGQSIRTSSRLIFIWASLVRSLSEYNSNHFSM